MSGSAEKISNEIDESGFSSNSQKEAANVISEQKDNGSTSAPDITPSSESRIAQFASLFSGKMRFIAMVTAVAAIIVVGRLFWGNEPRESDSEFQMAFNTDVSDTPSISSADKDATTKPEEIPVKGTPEMSGDRSQGETLILDALANKDAQSTTEAQSPEPYAGMSQAKGDPDEWARDVAGEPTLENVSVEPAELSGTALREIEVSAKKLPEERHSGDIEESGGNDLIDAILLQVALADYPTREDLEQEIARVPTIEKEDMDTLMLGLKKHTEEIRQLHTKLKLLDDTRAMTEGIRKNTDEHTARFAAIEKGLNKLKKNSGWHQNRITDLENGSSKKPPNMVAKAEDGASAWSVNGATENLAFIQNTESRKRLRVTPGIDIPGCGEVTGISPADQQVTTTSCVISN